ncbi:NAD(P)/FAD-dependent oxidoreductase [Herbidospora sp. RD11066]
MQNVIVVGAGIWGASLALRLAESGRRVTLIERLAGDDPRRASAGETRLVRSAHGTSEFYAQMAWHSTREWLALNKRVGEEIFLPQGVMWFGREADGWEARSAEVLKNLDIPCTLLDSAEAARFYPELRHDDLATVLYEPQAGVVRARRATEVITGLAQDAGVTLIRGTARPAGQGVAGISDGDAAGHGGDAARQGGNAGGHGGDAAAHGGDAAAQGGDAAAQGGDAAESGDGAAGRDGMADSDAVAGRKAGRKAVGGVSAVGRGVGRGVGRAVVVDGEVMVADQVVWACGAWLPGLFEGLPITVTRQDTTHFAAGWTGVPAFCDYSASAYGHGDIGGHGMKITSDVEGEPGFDPESARGEVLPSSERRARDYLARRFPSLAEVPLGLTQVCQYAITPDAEWIITEIDEGVWVLGGDSGHGFKHAPALATYLTSVLNGEADIAPRFGLHPRESVRGLRTSGDT